jgi:ABC-type multidrug transport system ATPase subunit
VDKDPLRAHEARDLVRKIVREGSIIPTKHFKEEAAKDHLTILDATNVLLGGAVDEPEYENGSWRYRVRTHRIEVIVAFESEEELVLVTIYRRNP